MNKVRLIGTIFILVWLNSCSARRLTTEDGKQYYVEMEQKFTWFEALKKCTQMNMTLISMDSWNKNRQLNKLFNINLGITTHVWIGGHDHNVSRHFEWISTGEAFDYTNWYPGEPNALNNHCVFMYTGNSLQWHDYDCNNKRGFVCEEIPPKKMTNAEFLLLKASAEKLKEKTEELDSLTTQFEMLKKTQTNLMLEFDKIKNLSEQRLEEIKQNQEEIAILKQSSEQQMTHLNQTQIQLNALKAQISSDSESKQMLKDIQTNQLQMQNQIVDKLTKIGEINQIEAIKSTGNPENPMFCATQHAALLKAKTEELQALQKSSELVIAHLFGALQKSYYELNTNHTTPNNVFPNFNKN